MTTPTIDRCALHDIARCTICLGLDEPYRAPEPRDGKLIRVHDDGNGASEVLRLIYAPRPVPFVHRERPTDPGRFAEQRSRWNRTAHERRANRSLRNGSWLPPDPAIAESYATERETAKRKRDRKLDSDAQIAKLVNSIRTDLGGTI